MSTAEHSHIDINHMLTIPGSLEEGGIPSRHLSEEYFRLRDKVLEEPRTSGELLCTIQEETGEWARQNVSRGITEPFQYEDYAVPSYENVIEKYYSLAAYLRKNHAGNVSEDEIESTRLFIESSFAMHEDVPEDGGIHPDADASFAFVVPTRLSRKNTEYGPEAETIMPLLRYLPNEMRAAFAVGLPPAIIDTYNRESDGRRGYLVLAPLFTDMMEDLDLSDTLKVADAQVNRTIDFAYSRLGAEVQGLGAIIPALTRFGQKITNQNVITTTGHGGTIQLIMDTIDRAEAEGYISQRQLKKIGVLGLGSIGQSIAEITRQRYPDAALRVYDTRAEKTNRIANAIGAIATQNEAELISESQVIISAVTSTIDVEALGLSHAQIRDKLIIDDSQPCSFDPEQVRRLGGQVAWVIGTNSIRRTNYDFGGSMADTHNDIFGCEGEAAAVAAHYRDLIANGVGEAEARQSIRKIALREAVTADKTAEIGKLFRHYDIQAAPLQAFGSYLEPKKILQQ